MVTLLPSRAVLGQTKCQLAEIQDNSRCVETAWPHLMSVIKQVWPVITANFRNYTIRFAVNVLWNGRPLKEKTKDKDFQVTSHADKRRADLVT